MTKIICFIMLMALTTNVFADKKSNKNDLIVILNENNIGDQHQVKGIAEYIKKLDKTKKIKFIKNSKVNKIDKELNKICHGDKKSIILTAGLEGIKIIKHLSPLKCKNSLFVNSSHMIFEDHYMILPKIDLIIMPTHALNENFIKQAEILKTNILPTIGVAHNLSDKTLLNQFKDNEKNFSWLQNKEKIAMIVLGGDAPDIIGKIKYYTVDEAVKTAEFIGSFCKNNGYSLMIFNGARTGLHNPSSGNKYSHIHEGEKLDKVTTAFVNKIKTYISPKESKLYDFQHNKDSLVGSGLWIIKNNKEGKCFLPGESTSIISEAVSLLLEKLIVINNQAMSENHLAHTKLEASLGHVKLLDNDFNEIKIPAVHTNIQPSAAKIASETIIRMLQ